MSATGNRDRGQRLKEERGRIGLSQTAFGALAGMSRDAQAAYESGRSDVGSDYLSAIAAAGADVLYILTGVRSGGVEAQPLTRDEECLLDNYRNSNETGKQAVQTTFAALAQSELVKKGGKKAG